MVGRFDFPLSSTNQYFPTIDSYLDTTVRYVPEKIRQEQRAELETHLRVLIAERMAQGESEAEAMAHAFDRFGNPNQLGRQLGGEMWRMATFRSISTRAACASALLLCGLPIALQSLVYLAGSLPRVCPIKPAATWIRIANHLDGISGMVNLSVLLFLLLALPICLAFRFSFFEKRQRTYGWSLTMLLLFAGAALVYGTHRSEPSLLVMQTLLPPLIGISLSLFLRQGRFVPARS